MVDVSAKPATLREAVARGHVSLAKSTLRLIHDRGIPKGDVLAVARIAGIVASKRVDQLLPLCHTLPGAATEVAFWPRADRGRIEIESRVRSAAQTGVEMEALTAVSAAALTIYDMCKAVDRGMTIGDIRLVRKAGGRSGTYVRPGEPPWPAEADGHG
jgi:cyclic pyranopterin phosphate synthase